MMNQIQIVNKDKNVLIYTINHNTEEDHYYCNRVNGII